MILKLKNTILGVCLLLIGQHAYAQPARDTLNRLPSENYITKYGNLDNFKNRLNTHKDITIAFLGGSITNMIGWRNKVEAYLTTTYPAHHFKFINAGIPSLGSLPHAFRFKTDVLDKGPIDLLFIEAAVNDKANRTAETTQRRAMEGIIRHAIKANPLTDMVVMAFADEFKNADYHMNKVPTEVQVHQDMAAYYHIIYINLAKEIYDRIDHKEFTWKDDFKSIHPSPFGQQLYFNAVERMFVDEMKNPASARLVKHSLPKALDMLNYENGDYLNINNAINLNGFKYITSWHPADSVHTREGFVDVPVLETIKPGASFELSFSGSVVGAGFIAGPDAGMLRYSIDDKDYPVIDVFNPGGKNLHLPSYLVLGDGLTAGKHLLRVTLAGDHNKNSKGTACRIVYFLTVTQ